MVDNWHSVDTRALMTELGVKDDLGLTSNEANLRLNKYGLNELQKSDTKSPITLFFEQFMDPLVIILLIALLISVVSRETGLWVKCGVPRETDFS